MTTQKIRNHTFMHYNLYKNKKYIMKKNTLLLIILCLCINQYTNAQTLKRKAWFGTQFTPIDEGKSKIAGLKSVEGLLAVQVVGGTGKALNLQPQDVLLEINGTKINSTAELSKFITTVYEGDKVEITIFRNKKKQILKGTFVGRDKETDAYADVIYDHAAYKGGNLRVIINKPKKEGKMPAVLFIPGYTCSSIDGLPTNHPYAHVVHDFSKAGYVVLRIEKSGLGDSQNTPKCEDCNLTDEIENFEKGLLKLKSLPYVDTEKIFIFGHSMGGVVAPALSAKHDIKGVIVYGTTAKSWYEYQLELNRFQSLLATPKPNPMEFERYCREQAELNYEYFIQKKSLEEIAKTPHKDSLMREGWQYDGKGKIYSRNAEYWRQIQDMPLLENWKNTKAHVLVMYGGADFQAFSKPDHEQIVYTVNHFRPNTATLKIFPETDHYLAKTNTYQNAYDMFAQGKIQELFNAFDPEVTNKAIEWANGLK